jgi:hypothetical protein
MEEAALVGTWRSIIREPEKSWVLFANGTCVIPTEPGADLARQATELLREWGPVHEEVPDGDDVVELEDGRGWVVAGPPDHLLNYVAREDAEPDSTSDTMIGLLGRSRRGQDAAELRVIHVEDRRGGSTA